MLYLKKGFTLIEMLIVVVIIGILASIAFPSYKAYILKSHRTDGLAALSRYQSIMERCYAQNFSYNAACAALPAFPVNSAQNYYSISASNLSATTFTLTATPIGIQATDTLCSSISLNQANQKTALDSSGGSQSICWNL